LNIPNRYDKSKDKVQWRSESNQRDKSDSTHEQLEPSTDEKDNDNKKLNDSLQISESERQLEEATKEKPNDQPRIIFQIRTKLFGKKNIISSFFLVFMFCSLFAFSL
jgi:hypothetical protein